MQWFSTISQQATITRDTHDSDEVFNAHHESKCNLYTFHDPIK